MLLEAVLRECDDYVVTEQDVRNVAAYNAADPGDIEIPFKPARVVLQDFTGVQAVVDLAALRHAMYTMGGDPKKRADRLPGQTDSAVAVQHVFQPGCRGRVVDAVLIHCIEQQVRVNDHRRADPARRRCS